MPASRTVRRNDRRSVFLERDARRVGAAVLAFALTSCAASRGPAASASATAAAPRPPPLAARVVPPPNRRPAPAPDRRLVASESSPMLASAPPIGVPSSTPSLPSASRSSAPDTWTPAPSPSPRPAVAPGRDLTSTDPEQLTGARYYLALAVAAAEEQAQKDAAAKAAAPKPKPLPHVESSFAYDLASPSGVVPLSWPSLAYDRAHDEVFVVAEGFVRIFDSTGMETHRFGDDGSLGTIARVAILDEGQLITMGTLDGKRAYFRCDFRGDPIEPLELSGLPKGYEDFLPDQLVQRDGSLYFAERGTMRVVVTDLTGRFRQAYPLRDLVWSALAGGGDGTEPPKPPGSLDAFNVDSHGNLLFTMSTLFAGAIVSPAGQVRLFGARGSRPGCFNIIGGIDADENGYVFVTDRLRSVVSVWDRQLHNLGEFGYRGDDPSNLLTPYEVAVGNGKVIVTQAGRKGVKVFRVQIVDPQPVEPPATPPPLRVPPNERGVG